MKIFLRKCKTLFWNIKIVFVFLFFVCSSSTNTLASKQRPIRITEQATLDFFKSNVHQYLISVNEDYKLENECPTLAYLNMPNTKSLLIKKILNQGYMDDFINDFIKNISPQKVENIVNTIIEKELEMHKNNYVFYHGMQLEFLLYQDLFSLLFKLCKKTELKNFFMLRNPSTTQNYADLKDLSIKKCLGAPLSDFKELEFCLLSVVPSLFSYTYSIEELCSAFFYFLKSYNIHTINNEQTLARYIDIFNYFKIEKQLFEKYKTKLQKMLEVLQEKKSDSTGLLLQLFIPKTFNINDIAYPILFTGYWDAHPLDINSKTKASDFLEFLPLHYAYNYIPLKARDQIQMRIYLKPSVFLNPLNPEKIKMFRYYNKTESTQKYENLFKEFAEELAKDLIPANNKNERIIEKENEIKQKPEKKSDEDIGYCIVS